MLVDTNLLLYAAHGGADEHVAARTWLEARLADDGGLVLCWPVLYAYLRLSTSKHIFGEHALDLRASWDDVAAYLGQPGARVITAGPLHESIAAELTKTPGLRSDDVPDIELAALAIEHGLVLASHDSGFRRFAALRTFDPLN